MTLVLRAGEQTITHALGRTPTGLVSLRGGAVSLVSGDTGTARVSAETAGEHTVLIT